MKIESVKVPGSLQTPFIISFSSSEITVLDFWLWSALADCGFLHLILPLSLSSSSVIVFTVVVIVDFVVLEWKRQWMDYHKLSGDVDKQLSSQLKEWLWYMLQQINFGKICNKLKPVCKLVVVEARFPVHAHACDVQRFSAPIAVLMAWGLF